MPSRGASSSSGSGRSDGRTAWSSAEASVRASVTFPPYDGIRPERADPATAGAVSRQPGPDQSVQELREVLADDACAHREGHHLGAVARTELAGDAGEVTLDGQRGEAELVADLLVGLAVGHEAKDLELAAGELLDTLGSGGATQANREQRGDRRVGVDATVENPAHTVGDDEWAGGLEQVALGAGDEGGTHGVRVVSGRQHHQARPAGGTEVGQQVEARAVGQAEVENAEVTRTTGVGTGPGLGDRSGLHDLAGTHGREPAHHGL